MLGRCIRLKPVKIQEMFYLKTLQNYEKKSKDEVSEDAFCMA